MFLCAKKNTEIWNFKHKETCSNYDMIHVLFLSIELELEQYVTNLFDRHTCTMHLYCRKYTLDLWYSIHSQIKFSYYYLYILCQCSKSKPGDVNHRQQQKFEWFLTKVERSCTTSEISELCRASLDLFRYHTYKHFIIFIWLFVFRELFPIDSIKTFVHCCLIHFLCDRVKQYHEIFYFLFSICWWWYFYRMFLLYLNRNLKMLKYYVDGFAKVGEKVANIDTYNINRLKWPMNG